MRHKVIRIATRQSRLAVWQSQLVADRLCQAHADVMVELVPMKTEGDRRLDDSLAKIGGKGLFIKELEVAMRDGRADIAVHSMKDLPMILPTGFALAAVLPREDARDALVDNAGATLGSLAAGARIGTSSLRRQAQIRHARSDLEILPLRGNVDTRLRKLDAGDYDAIVLASAGLKRLGLADRISEFLAPAICLPAAAQGAIGIECRSADTALRTLLGLLEDAECRRAVDAERAFARALGASCTSPVAAYARIDDNGLHLTGRVAELSGKRLLEDSLQGRSDQAEQTGEKLAQTLIARGALALLAVQPQAESQ